MLKSINRKVSLLVFSGLMALNMNAQSFYKGNNFVSIPGHSSPEQVARIAAGVTPSPRQLAWQEMELTTFIHFTLNTFYNQEWGHGTEDPAKFNPTELNASQWVKVCKDAGSKCVIITCKHHDGFCLWPSKFTNHTVASSPWRNGKGDLVKEVSDACRKQGMKFGIYLSPWDRHEKSYGSEAYNQYFLNQLNELLSNYGEVAEVWFDGACGEGPNGKKQVYDWEAYYALIRKLQPNAVIAVMGPDVRWVGTESGYGRETEWSVVPYDIANQDSIAAGSQQQAVKDSFIPAGDMMAQDLGSREAIKNAKNLIWYPSEVDVSIRPGWFWHENENSRIKTPEKLVDIYYSSIGRNSLLLLNIPPDTRGLIHENDVASLQEWRSALNSTFKNNLAANAKATLATSKGITSVPLILDGNDATNWETTESGESMLELDLGGFKTFDVLLLQENIRVGQRVEKIRFQAFLNNQWTTVAEGTTIGYKRLLRFAPVISDKVRLVIEQSRLAPALSEFGLYLQPPSVAASPATAAFTDSMQVVLSSNSPEAAIFYTTDGSKPGKYSARYIKPTIIKQTTELNFVAIMPGGERSFYGKGSYNKARYGVILKNSPDKQYDGGGPLGLVDGVEGSIDFGDGKWTGINGKDLDATVDMGKETEIHTISITFNETTASWIFRPTEVSIQVSENGKDFRTLQSSGFGLAKADNTRRFVAKAKYDGTARYVRVIAKHLDKIPDWHPGKGLPAWVFADEIKIE